jgi:hypothetical protein
MSKDIAVVKPDDRFYFSRRGFYQHVVQGKWARIKSNEIAVLWIGNIYRYERQREDGLVRSLRKEDWAFVKEENVPVAVRNQL